MEDRRSYTQGSCGFNFGIPSVRNIFSGIDRICVICRFYTKRWTLEVGNRFQHTKEQKPNTHACRKDHGKPCYVGILGFRICSAKAYLPKWRECYDQTKKKNQVGSDHEQPIKVCGEPDSEVSKEFGRTFLENQGSDDKNDNSDTGNNEYRCEINL